MRDKGLYFLLAKNLMDMGYISDKECESLIKLINKEEA